MGQYAYGASLVRQGDIQPAGLTGLCFADLSDKTCDYWDDQLPCAGPDPDNQSIEREIVVGSVVHGRFPAPDRLVGQVAPGSSIEWLHVDHLGSTRVVTDQNGEVVSRHKYLPFGQEFTDAGADQNNTHKFTGHARDKGTGLDYMMARYYSPETAFRFLSVDPASRSVVSEDPQTWNRYTYTRNRPVQMVDPDGEAAHIAGGALIGALWGGGAELVRQLRSGEDINIAKVGTKAGKGMIVGAVAAATGGLSLGVAAAAVGSATVVAGIADRALDTDSDTESLNVADITTDAASGAAGGAAGAKVGQFVASKLAGSSAQKVAARQAASRVRAVAQRSPSRQAGAISSAQSVAAQPEQLGRAAAGAARSAAANATRTAAEETRERLNERKD